MRDAVSGAESREGMTIAMDDQQNCDLLETIRGSFGTSTLTQIVSEQRSLVMLPLNGVAPGIDTVIDGRYPHYKPFLMVTGPRSSSRARTFVEFVQSPVGRKILARTGNYVPRGR
jgi:phosphate transport system substrate-binding protein